MSYKRFIKRDGKVYGPYTYESKRVNGKVVSSFVKDSDDESSVTPHKVLKSFRSRKPKRRLGKKIHMGIFLFLISIVLLSSVALFISQQYPITGAISLDLSSYINVDKLDGVLKIGIRQGELVPIDSKMIVTLDGQTREYPLADIINLEPQHGDFYAENLELGGEGLGFGNIGVKYHYPEINFAFRLISQAKDKKEKKSDESVEEEVEEEVIEDVVEGEEVVEDVVSEDEEVVESEEVVEETVDVVDESVDEVVEEESVGEEVVVEEEAPAEEAEAEPEPESSPLTGGVVSENQIEGSVSKDNDFTYEVKKKAVEIISVDKGSVNDLETDIEEGVLTVSTDYFEVEEGFGEDFLGDEKLYLKIDLENLNLTLEPADLNIAIVYNEMIIAKAHERVLPGEPIVENVTSNETLVEVSVSNITVKQYKAVIGRPVKWVKKVSVDKTDKESLKINIPKVSENISIRTGLDAEEALREAEDYDDVVEQADKEDIVSGALTGLVSLDIDVRQGIISRVSRWVRKLRATGNVILEEEFVDDITETNGNKEINVTDIVEQTQEEDIAVEYYTEAPQAVEEEIALGKKINITGPDEVHYKDILAYSELDNSIALAERDKIKLYHLVNNVREETVFDAYDLDSDGNVDYIEWIVPHLSEQIYEIIYITKAQHLDVNRVFISDIYDDVREQDGNWSEVIGDGEYVRVTFEQALDNTKDNTIYARGFEGSDNVVEVYVENGSEVIARFDSVSGEALQKVYLTGLADGESYATFDLKVLGSGVEFDYIVDPEIDPGETGLVLLHHYNNDSTGENDTYVYDFAGGGGVNNGTITGGAVWTSSGKLGAGAFEFDGIDDRITVGDVIDVSNLTVAFWVKINENNTKVYGNPIVGEASNWNCLDWKVGLYSGSFINQVLVETKGLSDTSIYSNTKLVVGEWAHVVFVWNGTDKVIYMNGVQDKKESGITGVLTDDVDNCPLRVGHAYSGESGNQYLNGTVDELAVYNIGLTAAEVLTLYNTVSTSNTAPTNPTVSLVSIDGSETTASDLNCSATVTDDDADAMEVLVRWYNNSVLDMEIEYNNSYASGSVAEAILNKANLTVGDAWICEMRLHDGTDASAHVNSSAVTIVAGDTTLPVVVITYPANNSNHVVNNIEVNYTYVEANFDSVWWSKNDGLTNTTLTQGQNITGQTWSAGVNNIVVYMNDTSNNEGFNTITFNVDTVVPDLTIGYPVEGTVYAINVTEFNFSAADETALDSCWYSFDSGATNSTIDTTCANFTGLSGVNDYNNWTIYVNDTSGNENSSSASFYSTYISACVNLSKTGQTYNLYENISATGTCINITADSVTFDLNGNNITGDGDVTDYGVEILGGVNDTTIQNGHINDFGVGIHSHLGDNGTFESLTFNSSVSGLGASIVAGILIGETGGSTHSPLGNKIYNSAATLNGTKTGGPPVPLFLYGFYISDGSHNIFENLTSSNSGGSVLDSSVVGAFVMINNVIGAAGVSNNTIKNAVARDNIGIDYNIQGDNNTLINVIGDGSTTGISIDKGDNLVKDSNFTDATGNNVSISGGTNNTFLNVSYDEESFGVSGTLIREWYFRAYSNDTNGLALESTNVTAYNVTGDYMFNLSTDATGYTSQTEIIDYVSTGAKTVYSNYSIVGVNDSYTTLTQTYNVTLSGNNLEYNFEFNADSVLPVITMTYPANNSNHVVNNIEVNYTYVEANFDSVWWSKNDGLTNTTLTQGQNITGQTWSAGVNNIVVYMNDTSNNEGFNTITFNVDTVVPDLTIGYPVEGTVYAINVTEFNFSAVDETALSSCWYSLDDGVTNSSPDESCANVTGLSGTDGINNWTIYVNDTSGNENSTSASFYSTYISACGTLAKPGQIYTLYEDLTATGSCILIRNDSIHVNLNGHVVDGDGNSASDIGIDAVATGGKTYGNLSIYNGTITDFGKGVAFSIVNNSQVYDLNFTTLVASAINFYGIYSASGSNNNNTIRNNIFSMVNTATVPSGPPPALTAIYEVTTNNTIRDNQVVRCYGDLDPPVFPPGFPRTSIGTGIFLGGSFNKLINNTISNCHGVSLQVSYGGDRNYIANNTVYNNTNPYGPSPAAVLLTTVTNNLFIGNNFSVSTNTSISLQTSSKHNVFRDSIVEGCGTFCFQMPTGIGDNQNNTVINISYDISKEDTTTGDITRKWYFRAYANDTNGLALEGTNVTAYQITGDFILNTSTDDTGYTTQEEISEYKSNLGTITYHSNYSMVGMNDSYADLTQTYNVTLNGNNLEYNFEFNGDSVLPDLNLVIPVNNSRLNINTSLELNYTASDGTGLSSCWYTLNNGLTNSSPDTTCTNTTMNLTDETWTTVVVYVNDTNNNENSSSAKVFVDTIVSNLTFIGLTPANATTSSSANVFVNVSSSDGYEHISFVDWDNSLAGWWRMDDVDSSGNPTDYFGLLNGTKGGSAVQTSAGYLGKGFDFDGVYVAAYDKISLGTCSNNGLCLQNFTKSVWVKPAIADNKPHYIFNFGSRSDIVIEGVDTACSNNEIMASYYTGLFKKLCSGIIVNPNQWYHVVFVKEQGVGHYLYVDGALVASDAVTDDTVYVTTRDVAIGYFWTTTVDGVFNGTIDDVMIFNRSMSLTEVSAIHNATANQYYNNFTGLSGGNHVYTAYAQDMGGNINVSEERTVSIDATLPVITISYPANNSNAPTNTIEVNYTYVEANPESFWWTKNIGATNTTLTQGQNITGQTWSAGANNIVVYMNDTNGNENNTAISFTVDNVAPNVTINSPANASFSTDSIIFNVTVLDDIVVGSCLYSLNNGEANFSMVNLSGAVNDYNATNSSMVQGSSTVNFYCNDSLGNLNNSESVTFFVDSVLPVITISYPANNSNAPTNTIEVNYTYVEANFDSGWWSNDDGATNNTLTQGQNITGQTWAEGMNNVSVYMNDTNGNENHTTITFNVDSVLPVPAISYPSNTSYGINVSSLNYTFTEANPESCWYSVNGGVANSSIVSCGVNFTDVTSSEGSNTWNVYMNDSFGNENSTSVTFFKDAVYPNVSYDGTEGDGQKTGYDWVYVNVSFEEVNFANVSFYLFNSTGDNVNSTTFTSATYLLNWTGLAADNYTYHVNVSDIVGNVNSSGLRTLRLIPSCLAGACVEGADCNVTTECALYSSLCSGSLCDFTNFTISSVLHVMYNSSGDGNSLDINLSDMMEFSTGNLIDFGGKNQSRGGNAGTVNITTAAGNLFNTTRANFTGVGGFSSGTGNAGGDGGILQLNYWGLIRKFTDSTSGMLDNTPNLSAGLSLDTGAGTAGSIVYNRDIVTPTRDVDVTDDGKVTFLTDVQQTRSKYKVAYGEASYSAIFDINNNSDINVIEIALEGFEIDTR